MKRQTNELFTLFTLSGSSVGIHAEIRDRMIRNVLHFQQEGQISRPTETGSLTAAFTTTQTPDQPFSLESYVKYLEDQVVPYSVNMRSPQCIGHMSSVLPNFVLPLNDLIMLLNQNLVKRDASKTFTLLERQTLGMMHRVIYDFAEAFYTKHVQNEAATLGIMSSGGTVANITALWIARNSCLGPAQGFAGVEEEGMPAALKHYNYDGAVVIGSKLMHYSIEKAASLLGLGGCAVMKLPVDEENRVDLKALEGAINECSARRRRIVAVVGIAGSTDCGSLDPLGEMAELARKARVHFHVDAAWGAPLLFSRQHRCKLIGIEHADSITVDAHKQMYLPIGTSMLLLREPQTADVIKKHSHYMLQDQSGDLGRYSLQGSRPGTALFVHAALHMIGRSGYESIVDENIRKALEMASVIRSRRDFELLVQPDTNVVLYRYVPKKWRRALVRDALPRSANVEINNLNRKLQNAQCEAGRSFVSCTALDRACQFGSVSVVALRAVIGNPFTTEIDIERVLEDQVRIALRLGAN